MKRHLRIEDVIFKRIYMQVYRYDSKIKNNYNIWNIQYYLSALLRLKHFFVIKKSSKE